MDKPSILLGLALAELRASVIEIAAGHARPTLADDPDTRWKDGHTVGLLYGYRRSIAAIEHAVGLVDGES